MLAAQGQALTLVFLCIPLPCFPSWALCSSNGSESEVPAGVARACPAGISTFGKFVCRGILAGVFPRTLPHPLGPHSFPGMSPALGGGKVASPAAPASHLSLHKSREYSRAPVLALCGIPIGTGIFGVGLCLPVWNVEPCEPLSFGSASGKALPACHLCPISCWGSSEQDTSGFISCWILIASLELKPLAFLGEATLPRSSEALPLLLAGLGALGYATEGGKQPSILRPHAHPGNAAL